MNKKDQKAKESNDKQKSEEVKTERSPEKLSNSNNKQEKNNQNNSILETQPQQNNKNPNAKKENTILKNNINNNNVNNNNNNNNIKKVYEPTPEDLENANAFLQYIDESGLPEAFQLIFAELVSKKINPQNYFSYVGMRLRQIGKEINDLKNN